MDLPRIRDYCDWQTDAKLASIGDWYFYFSYQTCIAFRPPEGPCVKSENVWSKTTGRHLNRIPGDTVPGDEFERLLAEALKKFS